MNLFGGRALVLTTMPRKLLQLVFVLMFRVSGFPHAYHDCTKIFNPQNYIERLPSLELPYVNKLPIPNTNHLALIKPSPVVTTRVISVITKYISKSPMCIKVDGVKPPCQIKRVSTKRPLEFLITKEYFVKDRRKKSTSEEHIDREHKMLLDSDGDADDNLSRLERLRWEIENYRNFGQRRNFSGEDLEGSESRGFSEESSETPQLSDPIRELLIEDRLDKLEGILPYYTRKRTYKTSTITVTRTRTNSRTTATLTVKNCIPEGIEYCKLKKSNKRSPKHTTPDIPVAQPELNSYSYHYG